MEGGWPPVRAPIGGREGRRRAGETSAASPDPGTRPCRAPPPGGRFASAAAPGSRPSRDPAADSGDARVPRGRPVSVPAGPSTRRWRCATPGSRTVPDRRPPARGGRREVRAEGAETTRSSASGWITRKGARRSGAIPPSMWPSPGRLRGAGAVGSRFQPLGRFRANEGAGRYGPVLGGCERSSALRVHAHPGSACIRSLRWAVHVPAAASVDATRRGWLRTPTR